MSKTRVNYKSDLPPIEVTFKVNTVAADVPENDFVLRFFVDGCSESYFCGCRYEDGEPEYTRCAPTSDGKKLICYISNHKFTPGRLRVEYIDLVQNSHYEDGVKKTVVPDVLDVVLVDGAGDEVDNVVTDNFHLTVGRGILDVVKTDTVGIVDTYTIYFDDGKTETYTITNGRDGVDLGEVAVADDLVTNDSTKVLSAKQGYILGGLINNMYSTRTYDDSDLTKGKVWQNMNVTSVPDTMSNQALAGCIMLEVKEGDKVVVNTMSDTYRAAIWAITDTDRNILSNGGSSSSGVTSTLNIEQDGYVFINCKEDYYASFSASKTYAGAVKNAEDLQKIEATVADLGTEVQYDSDDLVDGYWNLALSKVSISPTPNPSDHKYKCMCLKVKAGDTINLTTQGKYTARPWGVTDTGRNIVSVHEETSFIVKDTLNIEQDGFVFINCMADDETVTSYRTSYLDSFRVTLVKTIGSDIRKIPEINSRIGSEYEVAEYDADSLKGKSFWKNAGSVVTVSVYTEYDNDGNFRSIFIPVFSGDTVSVKTRVTGAEDGVAWCVTDTNRNILAAADPTDDPVEETLQIEQDGFVFINCDDSYEDEEENKLFSVTHTYNKVRSDTLFNNEITKKGTKPTSNLLLMYYGNDTRNRWTPSELEYALVHTHHTGRKKGVTEWFFSDLLYLEFRTNDKRPFGYNASGNRYDPARRSDYDWLLGRYFSERGNGSVPDPTQYEGLRALEYKVGELIKKYGEPPRRHKVVLGLPLPYYYTRDDHGDPEVINKWGVLKKTDSPYYDAGTGWQDEEWEEIFTTYDANDNPIAVDTIIFDNADYTPSAGEVCVRKTLRVYKENGVVINNTGIVLKWFIDRLIATFNSKNYQNFDLEGFYWIDETLTYPQFAVQPSGQFPNPESISDYIHGKGYEICWIPFTGANGRFDTARLKMDAAYLQTGYFWKDGVRNEYLMTEQEMRGLYQEAVMHGMGLEIEVDDVLFVEPRNPIAINESYMKRLETLMDVFEEEGYFSRVSIAYYLSAFMVITMSQSPVARVQSVMDRLSTLINNVTPSVAAIVPALEGKQDALVSGVNIKTINNQSLLGSGNITIQGGGGGSQIQSDWSQSDSTAVDFIKNKPTLATVATSGSYNDLSNKPTIPAAQIQADWNQSTTTAKDYIKNKPTIPTKTSDLTNDSCPIIEDTRSQATDVNITGAAPFATLAGGQRIVLHFKYANTASPTLQLTLSGGTTTSAYPLYQNYNNGVNALTLQAMPAGSYGEFVFDSTNSRWVLIGKDFNTTYSNTSQADINNSAQGSRLIEPKLLRDNFYLKSEVNSICPIIEDTRSSNASNITGVAPFSTLVDKQKVIIHLAYATGNYTTLQLTLNDGVTTTNAIPIYARTDVTWVGQILDGHFRGGTYMELIYNSSENRWYCLNLDRDTTTWAMGQSDINNASNTDPRAVPSAKLLCDNFSKHTKVVEVSGATVTQTLNPNTFYKFTGSVTSLTLTLGSEVSGITNIFAFSFTAGQDAPTITLPQSVTIADAPDIHSGDYVEFNILDGKAIAKVWSA